MARAKSSEREKRIPFGVSNRQLTIDQHTAARLRAEGLEPRFVNDDGAALEQAIAGWYEFISTDSRAPITTGEKGLDHDTRVRKLVGKQKSGAPLYAYLMAIPRKYYDEDQGAKEVVNFQVDEQIRSGAPKGLKGHGVSQELGGASVKNVNYTP